VGSDPVAGKAAAKMVPELKVVFDPYDALAEAHAAVLVTEWGEIHTLGLKRAASPMRRPPLLIDGRNVFDALEARAAGLRYRGFGRG
jgi:UDPglucose 6-dehydrogenase